MFELSEDSVHASAEMEHPIAVGKAQGERGGRTE